MTPGRTRDEVLAALRGGFVTSCQPHRGGVFDAPEHAARFARAAEAGGTHGLRAEGLADVRAIRVASPLPLIGLVKRTVRDSDVFITPELADVTALARLGVDAIAFDATHRPRPVPVASMVDAIHAAGLLSMADVATLDEGRAAREAGAELVGTTLSGYAPGSPKLAGPDLDLVEALSRDGVRVIAEGRISTPEQAADAIRRGAFAVTVGTAITRPEVVTAAFVEAVRGARS